MFLISKFKILWYHSGSSILYFQLDQYIFFVTHYKSFYPVLFEGSWDILKTSCTLLISKKKLSNISTSRCVSTILLLTKSAIAHLVELVTHVSCGHNRKQHFTFSLMTNSLFAFTFTWNRIIPFSTGEVFLFFTYLRVEDQLRNLICMYTPSPSKFEGNKSWATCNCTLAFWNH